MDEKGHWERQGEQWEAVSVSRWEGVRAGTGVIAEGMVKREGKRKLAFPI